jgi:Ser/Thr protein kinase RdoA (MazF antagonist)
VKHESAIRREVLPLYDNALDPDAALAPLGAGLINDTYLVTGRDGPLVLQRVNPIFPPAVQDNIEAVTTCLARQGLQTPRLVRTRAGALCVEAPSGVWRVMTFVEGASFDVIASPAQARAAGALVARFHRALEGLSFTFAGLRTGVHDTARHFARLAEARATLRSHRLFAEVDALGAALLAAAERLPPLPALPDRVCHGDLKFNNVRFAGAAPPAAEEAVCLIDLDTVGPGALAFELGDAWRSWCNRNGEDQPEAALDLEVFASSLDGYRSGLGRALGFEERQALLLGVEWVSLELSARFAADALFESYFGWDPARFPGRGEHNLVRARSQFSLHQALVESRPRRARALEA